jgi:membrane protein involved in colicin uptake
MDRIEIWHKKEKINGRKGMITAIVTAVIILLILFFFIIPLSRSEDQVQGVLIDFGTAQTGLGDNSAPKKVEQVVEETRPFEASDAAVTPAETATPDVADEVITQDFEEAPAINSEDEIDAEQLAAEQAAAEAAAAQAAAEAAAQAELEAQQQAAQELKDELDGAWGAAGDGNTTPGGDQGVADGVDNGPYNDGSSSTGLGDSGIGHDLSGRKMVKRPTVDDTSQKTGRVAVRVRVDRSGNVVFAQYTSKGSNTTDSYLIRLAEQAARKAKFDSNFNAPSEQIGTIYFTFRVQ